MSGTLRDGRRRDLETEHLSVSMGALRGALGWGFPILRTPKDK
jgi:hypothetical protein